MPDSEALLVNSDAGYGKLLTIMADQYREHGYMVVTIRTGKQRTIPQNSAMHKYFELLADALNAGGFHQRKVLDAMKEGVEIPNTPESVKELWRKIQIAILNKESTAKLERAEVNRVHRSFNKWTFDTFNIDIPFPSYD
jgi:hypothetical protein